MYFSSSKGGCCTYQRFKVVKHVVWQILKIQYKSHGHVWSALFYNNVFSPATFRDVSENGELVITINSYRVMKVLTQSMIGSEVKTGVVIMFLFTVPRDDVRAFNSYCKQVY